MPAEETLKFETNQHRKNRKPNPYFDPPNRDFEDQR